LSLLGDRDFLPSAGASQASMDTLRDGVRTTQLMTPQNRDAMWTGRRHLFFKPAAVFGSKAAYRGDKITHRVWEEMAGASYVAQEIVTPSERLAGSGSAPFKVDIRCYAYGGEVLLYAARMYQGQTTNLRTPGGGFAPVLTARTPARGQDLGKHPPTTFNFQWFRGFGYAAGAGQSSHRRVPWPGALSAPT
jgi:hypothetical protein